MEGLTPTLEAINETLKRVDRTADRLDSRWGRVEQATATLTERFNVFGEHLDRIETEVCETTKTAIGKIVGPVQFFSIVAGLLIFIGTIAGAWMWLSTHGYL